MKTMIQFLFFIFCAGGMAFFLVHIAITNIGERTKMLEKIHEDSLTIAYYEKHCQKWNNFKEEK